MIVWLRPSMISDSASGRRIRVRSCQLVQPAAVPASISIGVVMSGSRAAAEADELVSMADVALYAAKGAGRADWKLYEDHFEAEQGVLIGATGG